MLPFAHRAGLDLLCALLDRALRARGLIPDTRQLSGRLAAQERVIMQRLLDGADQPFRVAEPMA